MKKRLGENWTGFLDRYVMYAGTMTVSDQVQAVELYRKLPKELRVQISHLQPGATLDQMLDALRGVQYWAHCTGDKSVVFDPMDVNALARDRRGALEAQDT